MKEKVRGLREKKRMRREGRKGEAQNHCRQEFISGKRKASMLPTMRVKTAL